MKDREPDVKRMIAVPAAIALAITLARLVGELAGGPEALFNRAPGGGGALIGIAWLAPIFGVYFAVKLVRGGHGPGSAGRVIGLVVLGLVSALAIIFGAVAVTGDPNVPGDVSLAEAFGQQIGFAVATVVALLLVWRSWPIFFRTLFGYALASRIPVVIVMGIAMSAGWGTHYEGAPPGYPEMGLAVKFVVLALFPQLTSWIAYTLLIGGLTGGVAAALLRAPAAHPRAAPAA
jgi:hypothetical protein